MPSRTTPFVNGEYYHIFNRGVAKIPIFNNRRDYKRFLETVAYYQIDAIKPKFSIFTSTTTILDSDKNLVEIACYCLMPNHFHFVLRQVKDKGITEFVSKISNSYTRYFNTKNNRVGPLFQGEFKAVRIETDEQLTHVSRYVHLNPLIGYVTTSLDNYEWSSYLEYIGFSSKQFCSKAIVLNQFKSMEDYKAFTLDQESYARELGYIKHQLLDLEG